MTARCGSTARDLCSMPVSWLSSKWNVHLLKCVSQQWTRQCSCHLATNRPSCSERLWRQWLVFFSWEPVFCIFVLLFHWKVSLSRFVSFQPYHRPLHHVSDGTSPNCLWPSTWRHPRSYLAMTLLTHLICSLYPRLFARKPWFRSVVRFVLKDCDKYRI